LVESVAAVYPVTVVFVADDASWRKTAPLGADTVIVPRGLRLTDVISPRQCVGGSLGLNGDPLVVALTPNVAHLSLHVSKPVVLLEEGWERALDGQGMDWKTRARYAAERVRFRLLYRRVGRKAAAVVVITNRERSHFAPFIPEERLHVVRCGVDLDYFSRERVLNPVESDVLIFGALNRPQQRVAEFVTQLQALRPGVKVVIVGGSPRESVRRLASSSVSVTGFLEDVRPCLAGAKVVAVPTFIGIGVKTTLLQAWAMACPVVTTSAVRGGVEADAAFLGDTSSELAEATNTLLDDPATRTRIGEMGCVYVREQHDIRDTTRDLAEIVLRAV
jgi:glycosyltransferase involved in cell wall biosynthesis